MDEKTIWIPGETVVAQAYDNPIPGYGTMNSVNLRFIYNFSDFGNPSHVMNSTFHSLIKVTISKLSSIDNGPNTLLLCCIQMTLSHQEKN